MNISINNTTKADIFSTLFQHIKSFTENVNIMFEKERMYLQTMDSSRVSIVEIELPKSWFDEYNVNNNVCIGINATALFRILNARDKNQLVNIALDEDNNDRLSIHFTCENKDIFDKHFELPLIDIDADIMEIPEINSQADLTINSVNFANIINQLKMFGDNLDIECSEEKITLSSTTQETGKMVVDIKIDDLDEFAIDDGEELNLSFSLTYLHNICLYNKLSKDVEIKLTKSYPMKIVYYISDKLGKMNFYLAPKINDEDE
jgi:proliferating cell nuclear antigen